MGTVKEKSHDHGAGSSQKALVTALCLTGFFMFVEIAGGILTQSLALLSDAAHMFTDVTALSISLLAIHLGKRAADRKRSFGYYRFEILAAAFNAFLLFAVAIYILYEAYARLSAPPQIESVGMLIVAIIGLVVNLISMRLLSSGKEESLNVRGAYLEVWADLLGSVGVIAGALIIRFTGWAWVDSAVAVLIGFWVLPRTWVLLKSSMNVLLEGVPEEIDLDALEKTLLEVPGVASLHDLHVWSLTSSKISLTVHVVLAPDAAGEDDVLPAIRAALAAGYGIGHVTVQCERTPCEQTPWSDHYRPPDVAGAPHSH